MFDRMARDYSCFWPFYLKGEFKMIKKSITYTDYDGNERTEDFYFNITKAEFAEMDMSVVGGFEQMMKTLIDKKDIPGMLKVFKQLITMSYGVKSPDGRRMIKNQENLDDFMQTEAYSELFMELASSADKAVEFIKGIMPVDPAAADEALKALPANV